MSSGLLNTAKEVAQLPDGTLITWIPVMDDPSSEACAFIRKTDREKSRPDSRTPLDVWLAPGNGWAPESLDALVFPVRVVLLGVWQPGDFIPLTTSPQLIDFGSNGAANSSDFVAESMLAPISGGTYPRDVALQAAATLFSQQPKVSAQLVTSFAETFAMWLMAEPVTRAADDDQFDPVRLGDVDEDDPINNPVFDPNHRF